MIRILHMISSLEMGGSQTFVMNIYRSIDREQVQFDFIVDHTDNMYFKNEIEELGGRIYVMPPFTGTNYVKIKKEWNSFFKKHNEYKILHSHNRSYASIFLPIAKKNGVKTIIHSHNTSNGTGFKAIIKKILQFSLRWKADYYLACSKKAGEWLFGKKKCKSNNFEVIQNGIDVNRFIYDEKKRKIIRDMYKLDNTQLVVGYLARVTDQKNPFFVIDLFNEIYKKNMNSFLLFVGDGPLLLKVQEKTNKMGLSNNVIFAGNVSNSECFFSAMDVYILPSFWEGLGISLLEAQISGLKCFVSTNIQDEAIITNNVYRLPLDLGVVGWMENIQVENGYDRKLINISDIYKLIDVKNIASRMMKIYENILKG